MPHAKYPKESPVYRMGGEAFDRVDPKTAQVLGQELGRMEQAYGGITAAQLLEAAEPQESVFHPFFEWDHNKAAERYRLQQASRLIRWIKVEVIIRGSKKARNITARIRAFHSITDDKGRRYVALHRVRTQEEYRQQLYEECLAEMERWTAKAKMFKKLAGCVTMMQKTLRRLRNTRQTRPRKAVLADATV